MLEYGDMTDSTNLIRIMQQFQPTEIYNLAAQSHVKVSLRLRNTPPIRCAGHPSLAGGCSDTGHGDRVRFYQASTSELYGLVRETPQTETTPFYPRSRMLWQNFTDTGSLETTEKPMISSRPTGYSSTMSRHPRGNVCDAEITRAVARIKLEMQETLFLGN